MIPAAFEYHRPVTLQDAIALLGRLGEDAKSLAGGQSLIPLMKLRLTSPRHVVDVNRIPGLGAIAERDGVLVIGALVRESELEASDVVRRRFPTPRGCLPGDRGPARSQPGHGRRQPRPRGPRQRSPAWCWPSGREVVAGPRGPAPPRRGALHRSPHDRPRPRRDSHLDPHPAARFPDGRRVSQVQRKVDDFATAGVGVQLALPTATCSPRGSGSRTWGPRRSRPGAPRRSSAGSGGRVGDPISLSAGGGRERPVGGSAGVGGVQAGPCGC